MSKECPRGQTRRISSRTRARWQLRTVQRSIRSSVIGGAHCLRISEVADDGKRLSAPRLRSFTVVAVSYRRIALLLAASFASAAIAQTPDQVLVVENRRSATSHQIGEYYRHKRDIPLANLCLIDTAPNETIE